MNTAPSIKHLGLPPDEPTWRAMQSFPDLRDSSTPDEIWLVEHPPVFTLGLNASREHLLSPGDIPVVQIDRGGQVTYHGPGQLVVYPLIDLTRAGLGMRDFVMAQERAVIDLAAQFGIAAECRRNAPGVYVEDRKLASVGVRVRHGGAYHGLALNVTLDLEPFGRINPCGYQGLQMTRLCDLGGPASVPACAQALEPHLMRAAAAAALAALALAALPACSGPGETPAGAARITLLNVSYDPTRELYVEFNAAFARDWKAK